MRKKQIKKVIFPLCLLLPLLLASAAPVSAARLLEKMKKSSTGFGIILSAQGWSGESTQGGNWSQSADTVRHAGRGVPFRGILNPEDVTANSLWGNGSGIGHSGFVILL